MNLQGKLFWDVIVVIVIGGMFAVPVIAARSWYIELRRRFSLEAPKWRSILALISLAFASGSVILMLVCRVIGFARGGYPYYDPLLMRFYGFGFLSAAAALPFALIGKGRARWPSLGICLFMAFFWFMSAMAE